MTPIRALAIMAAASLTALAACAQADTAVVLPPTLPSWSPSPAASPTPTWRWTVTTPEDVHVCVDPATGEQVTSREVPDEMGGAPMPAWMQPCAVDRRPGGAR